MQGRVLVIAGSDSGGGAGIQGDTKTITACGGYAATAVTALTAQNTLGVHAVEEISPNFVKQQITATLDDIGADCIKTGMLCNAEIVEIVADTLLKYAPDIPLVIDPVMIAKGGSSLLRSDAMEILKSRLLPNSILITPNIPEAEHITGMKIKDINDMKVAGKIILNMGAKSVLIKGGHMAGETIYDVFLSQKSTRVFQGKRIQKKHTHGTGCTLASAIATYFTQQVPLEDAIEKAREYVFAAIKYSPAIGNGHGPLNHSWKLINT